MSAIKSICRAMERIAPLRLAEKWDNVGLLLEAPGARANGNRVLLTIDLTTAVADEAIANDACCVVSYHPTIFRPLTSLTLANPIQTSLLRCAANNISVYCPHTSLDTVAAGINTWLARAFYDDDEDHAQNISWIGESIEDGLGGRGRVATLTRPLTMTDIVAKIKAHLKLDHVQVAYAPGHKPGVDTVRSVAICAGSGESLLLGHPADVYFTGEMSHHDVLAAVASGHNVVLCGHSNTERGYLPTLAKRLSEELKTEAENETDSAHASVLRALRVDISVKDRDPLQIV